MPAQANLWSWMRADSDRARRMASAYGFVHDGEDLVIRIGQHVSDFRRDEAMSSLATSALPIPAVIEIGQMPSEESATLYYCRLRPEQTDRFPRARSTWPARESCLPCHRRSRRSVLSG